MTNGIQAGVLHFDSFELDLSSGVLRTAGMLISLQPQPFKVLAVLASNSGQAITRGEIRRKLWGDGTFVDFDGGLNFCIRQIRKALGEDARTPRYIETLPRRGYRFLVPVNRADNTEGRAPVAGGVNSSKEPPINVAVLPFSELSASAHANSLGDGITELLITYFSTNNHVRVVSRTSSMRYKHTCKSLPQIAKELRADRILKGAVLHSEGKVRITASLIDTLTNQKEWAGCYEAQGQDRLELQDGIARAVIHDTAAHLDLRVEKNSTVRRPADSRSGPAYFRTFQMMMPPSHKRPHA
jgi:TolB-like protein